MNERSLVYGLLTEIIEAPDASFEGEIAALLLRIAENLPPESHNEAELVQRAGAYLLAVGQAGITTQRAIHALLAAAKVIPSALQPIAKALEADPSTAFLRAIGFEMTTLIALSPSLAARGGLAIVNALSGDPDLAELEPFGHLLADQIPRLIELAPMEGTRLALGVMDREIGDLRRRYQGDSPSEHGEFFRFSGGDRAAVDTSWWMHGAPQDLEHVIGLLATAVFRFPEAATLCCRTLPLGFWTALASQCANAPIEGAARFQELLEATPLLSVPDIAAPLARFLEGSLATLGTECLDRIHVAVNAVEDDRVAAALASCLPEHLLSERLRTLREERPSALAELVRRVAPPQVTVSAFDGDAWLRMEGAEPASPENTPLLELNHPLEEFGSEFLNDAPGLERALEIVPCIHLAFAALKNDRGHELVQRKLADSMAAAADAVLRCGQVPIETAKALRPLLVFTAEHSYPPPGHPGFSSKTWGRPAPRVVGASAMMHYGAKCGVDDSLRRQILKLAQDPVEAVRHQIYVRSNGLFDAAPDLMWELLELWVTTEQGTLQFLVGPLWRVLRSNPSRSAKLLAVLWQRTDLEKGDDTRSEVAPLVALLAEEMKEPAAVEVLDLIFLEAGARPRALERILADMRAGGVWVSDDPVVRTQYIGFLRRTATRIFQLSQSSSQSERAAGVALADDVISQSVFTLEDANGVVRISGAKVSRFFEEAGGYLRGLLETDREDYRAYMKARLLSLWMRYRAQEGVVAAASFARTSVGAQVGTRFEKFAQIVLSISIAELLTEESRQAAIDLASRLAPLSDSYSVALRAFAARLARGR